jgi:hypothetical protein
MTINRGQIKHHMDDQPVKSHLSRDLFPESAPDQDLAPIWVGDSHFSWVFGYTHIEIVDNSRLLGSQSQKTLSQNGYYA